MCKMNVFLNFVAFLIVTTTEAQVVVQDRTYQSYNLIEPDSVNGEVDRFVIDDTEYLFVNAKMSFKQAVMLCNDSYKADLAFVKDLGLAKFLAEALSETNLLMDTLWIAGVRKRHPKNWWWIRSNHSEIINKTIVDQFVYNLNITAYDRNCLSFSRTSHDLPQFRPLTCRARRALMCERPRHGGRNSNSTHPGWIKIGRRYYKIFQQRITWENANDKCFRYDSSANLAVVISNEDAEQLGRYLLIGRPSLENAWIGARWLFNSYEFEDEKLILSNKSDTSHYPPWKNNRMKKPGGCVLLDRHLDNTTLFVEAHCERLRPYICYKIVENDSDAFSDIIIDDRGYRLQFAHRNWFKARDFCLNAYKDYGAVLVEIRKPEHLHHLLYVMGENKTAASHLWIGGKFNQSASPPSWFWDNSNTQISTGNDSILNWVKNSTYEPTVEEDNICLTMDRENHIVALNYGTICRYEQSFACQFTAEKLRELEEVERDRQFKSILQNSS